mmetsp:Transcript_5915/g.10523  ORF Transcript_5915/g.10523 Transcript_5915/m.10523 type:complete len:306 (-) Transcript_5915:11-928(-)
MIGGVRIGEDLENLSRSGTPGRRTPRSLVSNPSFSRAVEDEVVCRICMEPDSEKHKLIHPCKCSGSVKHIHEECLKTWITSHSEDIDKSVCELCKTPYVMEIKMTSKCSPREAFNEGMTACLFTPLLITVLIILILISYLLLSSYLPEADEEEERSYTIALIVTCLVSSVVILGLIVNSCKNACVAKKISSWNIMSQEYPEQDRANAANHQHDDSNVQLDQQGLIEDEVIVVPTTVKVKGRRVPTPDLRPCLTPLRSASSSVAYATPRTQSVNATPLRSRLPSVSPAIPFAKVRPEAMGNETQVN